MLSHVWQFAQVGHLNGTEVLGNLYNMSKHQLHKHTAGCVCVSVCGHVFVCYASEGLMHFELEFNCPCL